PRWAQRVLRLMKSLSETAMTCENGSIYDRMVFPAIGYAREELKQWMDRRRLGDCQVVSAAFERQLKQRLIKTADSAVRLHFQAFIEAHYSLSLSGVTLPTDNLEDGFFEHYGRRIIALFRSYPELARIWSTIIWQ